MYERNSGARRAFAGIYFYVLNLKRKRKKRKIKITYCIIIRQYSNIYNK